MNNDLISREALIKWIDDSVSRYGHIYSTDMLNMWGLFKDYLINNAPTVFDDKAYSDGYAQGTCDCEHAHERPQGKWMIVDDVFCQCSCCGNFDIMMHNYCCECGAKMEVKE